MNNIKKEEFLVLLTKELKRLEEECHISDLAENGQYEDVDEVLKEADYSILKRYADNSNEEFEELDIEDIPENYILTFAIYLSGSNWSEDEIFERWTDFQKALEDTPGVVGNVIAKVLYGQYINMFPTFEELIQARYEEI